VVDGVFELEEEIRDVLTSVAFKGLSLVGEDVRGFGGGFGNRFELGSGLCYLGGLGKLDVLVGLNLVEVGVLVLESLDFSSEGKEELGKLS
jgi:hypothetical protein